jgi:hypothetical protein
MRELRKQDSRLGQNRQEPDHTEHHSWHYGLRALSWERYEAVKRFKQKRLFPFPYWIWIKEKQECKRGDQIRVMVEQAGYKFNMMMALTRILQTEVQEAF